MLDFNKATKFFLQQRNNAVSNNKNSISLNILLMQEEGLNSILRQSFFRFKTT